MAQGMDLPVGCIQNPAIDFDSIAEKELQPELMDAGRACFFHHASSFHCQFCNMRL